jgi:probable selenium-dependent hydroxylase accessory protein YqeC
MSDSLIKTLELGPRELIALVGGGGKTTLMFTLARQIAQAGSRVVTGPTTKICFPEPEDTPLLMLRENRTRFSESVVAELAGRRHVTVGQCVLSASNKVDCCEPEFFNDLYRKESTEYVVVEADGARRLPIKAPRENEPVIPSETTMVIGLMGLDVLGKPLNADIAFQAERLGKIMEIEPGHPITARGMAALAADPAGLFKSAPLSARRVIFLNKLDALDQNVSLERGVLDAFAALPFHALLIWGRLLPEVDVSARACGAASA